jgi:hypothetical protein
LLLLCVRGLYRSVRFPYLELSTTRPYSRWNMNCVGGGVG